LKRVFSYGKPYVLVILLVLVMKLGAAVLDLMIPSALADIINVTLQDGGRREVLMNGLRMLGYATAEIIVNNIANVISSRVTNRMVGNMRQDLFIKVTNLSARQLDGVTIPSAISRLTSDTYNINNMFDRVLKMGIRAPSLMIGGIIVTFTRDPVLALIVFITMPLVFFVIVYFTRKAIPLNKQRQGILDRMVRTVQENASGIRVIKALSKTQYEMDRYDKVNNELAGKSLAASLINIKSGPFADAIFYISMVTVIVTGAIRVHLGAILPGEIMAFMQYFTTIINATMSISGVVIMCANGTASASRIAEVLEIDEAMTLQHFEEEKSGYALEFRKVAFSYNGVETNLKDVSFGLKKGQTLGVIGATGSGKTTLVNLLLRFYDVDEGQILLNGRDLRSIPNDELRKKFGVVFQNDFLVSDTIGANIDFYRGLDPENLKKAAVLAQAAEFIEEKEGGMEHKLTIKGNNLSGGQKQRLLIARALASDPEILVLDDSSSALDYRTDASLRKALAENFADTTKIIIAQRVSSIQGADCILVLENGEVIGQGTHEELMASCEEYRHIANTQMEAQSGKEATVNA